ncbi:MAG: amino acid permease [Thermacetogeniaceae bacterium]
MNSFAKYFRTKPVNEPLGEKLPKGLKRVLSVPDLIALGLGAIIGTGIFVLSGVAASRYAGPGVIISFIIAGATSALAALVYAELAAMFPAAGSAYTYTYASLGEIVAWLIGWNLTLEYTVAMAAVALGWSSYLLDLLKPLGVRLPQAITASPFAGGFINLPPLLIIALIAYLVAAGTKESSKVNKIVVALKISAIILFLALGLSRFDPANWRPFLPFGTAGIVRGAGIIFFAYIGFDAVATAAEEVRRPQRDLPLGILGALAISTLLYLGVAATLTGMVKYTALDTPSPVATALIMRGFPWAAAIVSVGALAGLTSVLLVNCFAQSRVLFAMSRDGMLPEVFSKIHPELKTPVFSIIATALVAAALSSLLPIHTIAELANIGTLSAFATVSLGVIVLRYTKPDIPRPFKVPLMPLLPLLSFAASVYLMANLPPLTLYRFAAWVAIGLIIYFSYSSRHSAVARSELEAKGALLPQPAAKRPPKS